MRLLPAHWAGVAAGVLVFGGVAYAVSRKESDVKTDDDTAADSPAALAADAGVSLAVYCLARATASEEGGEPRPYQVAVACAILNFARAEFPGWTDEDAVVKLVLGSAGVFGRQGSGGRRVSSARAPVKSQLTLAASVLAGIVADPTDGATQFDSPSGQRAQLMQGLVTKTPEEVADRRMGAGYELVTVAGVDPERLRFWRRA
jgi:spore germination cell wall hydrolase CwlJ-like protein